MKKWIFPGAAVIILLIVGIIIYSRIAEAEENDGGDKVAEVNYITMAEAKEIFASEGDYVIVDVRRADEFASGHIPGAIHVANESIISTPPAELPDKDQVIYVYCRSGRRSKDAASKLAAMGYTHIVECGGILDWTGDIVQ